MLCFVWLEHGKPVGAVYLLPSLLQGKRSFYSYAGGVLPGYRGKGIFKELFRVLMEFCKEEKRNFDWCTSSETYKLLSENGL